MSYQLEYQNRLNRNVICVLVFLFLMNIAQSWVTLKEANSTKISISSLQRPFELEFYDPSYMVYHPEALDYNLTIANDEYISFYVNFKQQFSNVHLHLKYVFADRHGNYNLIYVNKTINLCEFLANRKMDVLLRILFTVGERFGNLPKRCPLFKVSIKHYCKFNCIHRSNKKFYSESVLRCEYEDFSR